MPRWLVGYNTIVACPQCQGLEAVFGERLAEKELRQYRKRGPERTTRTLLDALRLRGIEGASVLDVGGGVGAIPLELLAAGARTAVIVDASRAYLEVAQREAERRGLRDRIAFHYGDAVEVCAALEDADVVTLDRVLCCYHDAEALVGATVARAERSYGLVYPRDAWWTRWGVRAVNLVMRLRGDPVRFFVHDPRRVARKLQSSGFQPRVVTVGAFWRVEVYRRPRPAARPGAVNVAGGADGVQ